MSRNDMVKTMQTQADEIEKLKQLLEQKTEKYTPLCQWNSLNLDQKDEIKQNKPETLYHQFVTQTFDQKYYLPHNIDQQIKYIESKIDLLQHTYRLKQIIYCLEHHKDGTVHAHMILCNDGVNSMCEFEYDLRAYFTNKPKYLNRINQKVDNIKESQEDWERVVEYIFKDPILIKNIKKFNF